MTGCAFPGSSQVSDFVTIISSRRQRRSTTSPPSAAERRVKKGEESKCRARVSDFDESEALAAQMLRANSNLRLKFDLEDDAHSATNVKKAERNESAVSLPVVGANAAPGTRSPDHTSKQTAAVTACKSPQAPQRSPRPRSSNVPARARSRDTGAGDGERSREAVQADGDRATQKVGLPVPKLWTPNGGLTPREVLQGGRSIAAGVRRASPPSEPSELSARANDATADGVEDVIKGRSVAGGGHGGGRSREPALRHFAAAVPLPSTARSEPRGNATCK